MPDFLFDLFLDTLGNLSYTVIWQTNSEAHNYLKNRTVPPNVILSPWVPLKILLGTEAQLTPFLFL